MKGARPSDHEHELDNLDEVLRSHGLRRTPQRQATLDAIAASDGHATAEQIVARVRKRLPAVSPSTIYRTLTSLEEVGVVCHAHLGHTASVYHLGGGGLHQHLVCERCEAIIEVDDAVVAPFAKRLADRYGFRADFTHFAVLGECASCAKRPNRSSRRTAPRR
ncbi:MAG TPA: Fur family transcriptional regulator [Actinomycetota bacterium]|nr:Fur family transcriptional regulator [Actinomycetota bacterium]